MSFQHMAWAMRVKVNDPLAKLVLAVLADRADKDTGQCWPSLARISEDTEMSPRTVMRKLAYLEDSGLITRTQRDKQSTLYTIGHTDLGSTATVTHGLGHSDLGGRVTVTHEPISKNLPENIDTITNSLFEDFWALYPKRVGKGQARKAFASAIKKATWEELRAGLQAYVDSQVGVDPKFIRHPSTWLSGEGWLDEITTSGWGDLNEL